MNRRGFITGLLVAVLGATARTVSITSPPSVAPALREANLLRQFSPSDRTAFVTLI